MTTDYDNTSEVKEFVPKKKNVKERMTYSFTVKELLDSSFLIMDSFTNYMAAKKVNEREYFTLAISGGFFAYAIGYTLMAFQNCVNISFVSRNVQKRI